MIKFLRNIFPELVPKEMAELLSQALADLPTEKYGSYCQQLKSGLLKYQRDADVDHPVFKNYKNFTYDPKISKLYYDPKGRFSRVRNISVENKKRTVETSLAIYFSYGLVCGYAFDDVRYFDPDIASIDISNARFDFLDEPDLEVSKLLAPDDRRLINWSDVFEVELDGKVYFHLKDIGDGDFIGIDQNRTLFEIRHDPFEIRTLTESFADIISRYQE